MFVDAMHEPGEPDDVALAERRARALTEAQAEARGIDGHAVTAVSGGTGGVGVRAFAPGRLVLALAGRFDGAGLEKLRGMTPMLEREAARELYIDLSRLRDCDSSLARVIGRLRIRRLADGARVQVCQPPVAVRRELGERPDTSDASESTIGDPAEGTSRVRSTP